MNAKEVEAAKAAGGEVIHVPVTIGAVAIIYNLAGVKDLKLSGEVLADIYLRKITKWNDAAIAALNPGVAAAGQGHRAGPPGRVERHDDIFTEYLSKRSAEFAKSAGHEQESEVAARAWTASRATTASPST